MSDLRAPAVWSLPTSKVQFAGNLNAGDPLIAFDPAAPQQTSNYSTNARVYDSLGSARTLQFFFNNLGGNAFSVVAMADGLELASNSPALEVLGSGSLSFTSDAALQSVNVGPLQVDFGGGAEAGQEILLEFGESHDINPSAGGVQGVVQVASPSNVTSMANGEPVSFATSVRLDNLGAVTSHFESGASLVVGQVALAEFSTTQGLVEIEPGVWRATADSVAPVVFVLESGGRGSISNP